MTIVMIMIVMVMMMMAVMMMAVMMMMMVVMVMVMMMMMTLMVVCAICLAARSNIHNPARDSSTITTITTTDIWTLAHRNDDAARNTRTNWYQMAK